MSTGPTLLISVVCVVVSLLADATSAPAAELPGSANGEVLVLRNGQVLTGTVTRLGDRFIIVLGDNAEINLSVADVELYCHSLDEAYQRKREEVRTYEIDDRLGLAEWCLAQGLTARAADQLLAARLVDPTNGQITLIERRLTDAPPPTATEKNDAAAHAPSVEELDQLTKAIDAATLERFVSSVQPVLLNRCSTSGCHGSNGTSRYRLLRPSVGDPVTRRFTQRNLHATLGQIDPDAPDASPLLTVPLAPHGTAAEALFDQRNKQQYEAIAAWVQMVARGETDSHEVTDAPLASMAEFPSHVLMQRNGARRRDPAPLPSRDGIASDAFATRPLPDSGEREQISRGPESTSAGGRDGAALREGSSRADPAENGVRETDGGTAGPAFIPRDEFDPEIFNRLYLDPPRAAGRR